MNNENNDQSFEDWWNTLDHTVYDYNKLQMRMAWNESTKRDGYILLSIYDVDDAIQAIKRSANIFYHEFGDWIEKESLDSLAKRLENGE